MAHSIELREKVLGANLIIRLTNKIKIEIVYDTKAEAEKALEELTKC